MFFDAPFAICSGSRLLLLPIDGGKLQNAALKSGAQTRADDKERERSFDLLLLIR
jgi:hypothetical protein